MEIKKISMEETFAVRQPVLRPGRPIEDCFFEYDDHPLSIHICAELNGKVISVLSAIPIRSKIYPNLKAMRIRGIATLNQFQRLGYGSQLVRYIEEELGKKGIELLWLNARINASKFYIKLGYKPKGDFFNIDGIGIHQKFFKSLIV
ncbi:MAG: hypothetical protein CBD72_03475 [Flavobacteriaceae bacterium TMED212]|nr:MAG: hypothetical protein CBD72_03475 [Flavobacteriaceae bacterium TMED212]